MNRSVHAALSGKNVNEMSEHMPKVTFIIDGEATDRRVRARPGCRTPHHGKPESFLDVAKTFRRPARARLRRQLRLHHLPRHHQARASRTSARCRTTRPIASTRRGA